MPPILQPLQPLARLSHRALAAGRQRQLPQAQLTPEEEESLWRKAGSVAVGGISAGSAILDVGGGAVRNLLSGRLPSANPVSWEGRTTGRELLEQYSVLGKNRPGFIRKGGNWYNPTDWDWGDIAGFGAEVALDPLTYLTFGASAVSKAGKAMKTAGLWDLLPGAAAKAGVKGRMATRMKMTPRKTFEQLATDIRPAAEASYAAQAKQMGVSVESLLDQPLGGGMRFWPTDTVIGKAGGAGEKIAGALDPIGEAIRYGKYSPVRPAYALLSKPLRGKVDPVMQKTLAARHAEGEFRVHQIKAEGALELGQLQDAGRFSNENIAADRAAVEWKAPEGVDEAAAIALDPINQLPPGIAQESVLKIRAARTRLLEDENFDGLATDAVEDMYAEYARRGMFQFDTPLAEIGAAQSRLRASHPSQISREDVLKNWKTGTAGPNALSTDPRVSGKHWRGVIGPDMSTATRNRLIGQYRNSHGLTRKQATEIVRDQYPRTSGGGANLDEIVQILNDDYGELLPDQIWSAEQNAYRAWTTQDTYRLAEQASMWDPQHVSTKTPLFAHHPSFDALNREIFSAKTTTAAHAIYDMAGESAVRFQDAPLAGRVSLTKLLKEAKLTGTGAHNQMIERIPKLVQKDANGDLIGPIVNELKSRTGFDDTLISSESVLGNIYVPQNVADNIASLGRSITDPASLRTVDTALGQFWDSWMNFFKGHVTAYWPAFQSRNFSMGQIQDQMGGGYGRNLLARYNMFNSLNDVWQVMLGRNIPDVLEIPMVKAAGITDHREGTRMVLSWLSGGEIGGRLQTEAAPLGSELASRSVEDFLGGSPLGAFASLNLRKRPGRNWWKPWATRGVGTEFMGTGPKREKSEFLLSIWGEDAGYVVETLNRFAPGISMLRRGIDPREAVRRVKLLQVDYMNQAIGDKYIRRAIPFFSFLKGMSKFLAEDLSQRPGGPLAQTIRAEAAMQREGLPAAMPEHIRQTAAIPLGEAIGGGTNVLTSLGFMHEDPLQFFGGVTSRGPAKAVTSMIGTATNEALSRLSPQLSVPFELARGRSLWQSGPRGGRALVDQYGHVAGLAGQLTGQKLKFHPAVEEIPQLLGAGRLLSTVSKALDPRKTLPQKAWNLLTGVHLTTVSPEQQEKVIGETVEGLMTDLGARQFERLYFPDEYMQQLPPAERQKRQELQTLRRALDKKWRDRKKLEAAQP